MSKPRILICEKNPTRRTDIVRLLQKNETEVFAVSSMTQAVRVLLEQNAVRLLVAGIESLGAPPFDILRSLRKEVPGLSIIGLAKVQNPRAGISLLKDGLFDSIAAPDDLVGLYAAVKNELIKKDLAAKNQLYARSLRRLKTEQSKSQKKASDIEELFGSAVENLMTALDLRDVETFGHSLTVAKYSQVLARLLGINKADVLDDIRKGALLHDIGKIAIPDTILKKAGSLTSEEWEKIKLHPSLGYGLIKEIKLAKAIGNIVLCHHERYDGSGYPFGLKKEKIPLEARIFALADALDAITAPRPYRKARDFQAAKKDIVENSGTQFDPKTVEAFCSLSIDKWERIRYETTSNIPNIEEFARLVKKSGMSSDRRFPGRGDAGNAA
jgi:putative nucleotidyltransferase with HDIG domain